MSKVKSPKQKKALSLERDGRNVYESSHWTTRLFSRRKQRTHQAERRAVAQELSALGPSPSEEEAIEQEDRAKTRGHVKALVAHGNKLPDIPLADDIARKKRRREQADNGDG